MSVANLARFLQADPFIEDASTLNRYTYVHNNPLAYTDPSGYFSLRTFLRTVVAIAITVYTGGALNGATWALFNASAWTTAAKVALVAASGAVSGAIQSGTIEGAAWGAFSAAIFFGIGQGIANADWAKGSFMGTELSGTGFAVKTVSHGLAGGTISKLQGGKFGHGFLSAAGSAATAPFADMATTEDVWKGAVVSSVVGGTLSKLSGGKFANGAVTAAMSYAFNQVASRDRQAPDVQFSDELNLKIEEARSILDRPAGEDGVKTMSIDELKFIMGVHVEMLDVRSAALGGYKNMSPEEFLVVLRGKSYVADSMFFGIERYGGYGGTRFRITGAPGGLSGIQVGGDINYFYQEMLHAAYGNSFSAAYNITVTYNLLKDTSRIPNRLRWTAYGYDFYRKGGGK